MSITSTPIISTNNITQPPNDELSITLPPTTTIKPQPAMPAVTPLPSFLPSADPSFTWGHLDSKTFTELISKAYKEVVFWRRNVFSVPYGNNCGKAFVSELARLFHAYAAGSALESITLKAVTVGSVLLLQKPSRTSKSRDHVECLERRLKSWKDGDIQTLLHEGKTIQHRLPTFHNTNPSTENSPVVRSFTKLMLEGKCKAAINLLTESTRGGCLKLDTIIPSEHSKQVTVLDALLEKHPAKQPASPDIILMNSSTPPTPHPIIFDSIDASTIRAAALHTDGSAGPSGIDGDGFAHPFTLLKLISVIHLS